MKINMMEHAGFNARINQRLSIDDLSIDSWNDEPSSVIKLYFCFAEQFRNIVNNGGIKEIQNDTKGFLNNITVG